MEDYTSVWEMIHRVVEILGIVFIPFAGWTMATLVNHGKQIIILEEKVNQSLNTRMVSLEKRFGGMEQKLEKKIDVIEEVVVANKISINETGARLNEMIADKFETIITKLNGR
mgnify:CR=1 FL=1|tara:strand:+ start:108 stop:446 length:339 start_codon:yes stop_codon:yes gene_type:complete